MIRQICILNMLNKGIIVTRSGEYTFDMTKICNEETLKELYDKINTPGVITIKKLDGEIKAQLLNEHINYGFNHFKKTFILYKFLNLPKHYNFNFKEVIIKSLRPLYKFEESINDLIFYLLNTGELYSDNFAPIYYSLSHFIKSMNRKGIYSIEFSTNFNQEEFYYEGEMWLSKQEYIADSVDEILMNQMDSFVSSICDILQIEEKLDIYKLNCTLEVRILNTEMNNLFEIEFNYVTPYEIFIKLSTLFKGGFNIVDISNLMYYN